MNLFGNSTCQFNLMDPLIGGIVTLSLSKKNSRLRQSTVKARCDFIGLRQEAIITLWNSGWAGGSKLFIGDAACLNAAADKYSTKTAADWLALAVTAE